MTGEVWRGEAGEYGQQEAADPSSELEAGPPWQLEADRRGLAAADLWARVDLVEAAVVDPVVLEEAELACRPSYLRFYSCLQYKRDN